MSAAEGPELGPLKKKEDEEERKGAGAAWSSSPHSLPVRLRAAARTVVDYPRSMYNCVFGPQGAVVWLRQLPSLGWSGAWAVLKGPLLQLAVTGALSYCAAQMVSFGIARALPHKPRLSGAGQGPFAARPAPKRKGGWLPADGLFGALPGLFTNKRGFAKGSSPLPGASILKEGAKEGEGAGGEGEAGEGEGGAGAEGAQGAQDETSRWAEALAEARGEAGSASSGLQKMPGFANSSHSSGAMGPTGPAGGGRGAPGARGGAGAAPGRPMAGGTLTAFTKGAPKRSLVAGNRIARALPRGPSERQRLMGTMVMSNEAAAIRGNEASSIHAGAPFDTNAVGAQRVGDPIGLNSNPARARPRSGASGATGGLPVDPNYGNPDLMRPDLGDLYDRYPYPDPTGPITVSTVPYNPNSDSTIYIRLVEQARALTTEAKDNHIAGIAKIAAGGLMVRQGLKLIGNPLTASAGWTMILVGGGLIYGGIADLARSNDQANQADAVADQIESEYGQNPDAQAIRYCVDRARQGDQCIFQGDELRSRQCGYRPKMTTEELRVYSACMAAVGSGLEPVDIFVPDGEPDEADPDKICRIVYPDAKLKKTGDPQKPYICVRRRGP